MGKYVFAPSGNSSETIRVLKQCIEYIGNKQQGSGSAYSRGKRYLRQQLRCSGASIKNLFKTSIKISNHDFEKYGLYVFRYDKKQCSKILIEIISYIELNANPTEKDRLLGAQNSNKLYLDLIFSSQKSKLDWVRNHNYKCQREDAKLIINELDSITDTFS